MLNGEGKVMDEIELIRDFKSRFQKLTGKNCIIIIENKIDQLLRKLAITEILTVVDQFKLPEIPALETASRKRELVNLRKIYCLLAKKAGYSLSTIGESIGERDHTTVIYNIKKAKDHIDTEESFRDMYYEVQNKLMEVYEDRLEHNKKDRPLTKRDLRSVLLEAGKESVLK